MGFFCVVRRRFFDAASLRLEQRCEPTGEHLFHRRVVVVARDVAHLETPVLRRPRQPVFEYDHRTDVVGPLEVAHVEALDP